MEKMIKVKKNISAQEVEELYSQIYDKEVSRMILPIKFEKQDFSQVPQLVQLIVTFLRISDDKKILLGVNSSPIAEEISDIINDPTLFSAIVFAWDRDILNLGGESIKKSLWQSRDESLFRMQQINFGKGNRSFSASFDHLPINIGLMKSWYSGDEFVSSERDLDGFLDKTLIRVGSFSNFYIKKTAFKIVSDLEGILFELLKNTDEHARTDESGNILSPNIRGVYSTLHRNSRKEFTNRYKWHSGLTNYFSKVEVKENEFDQIIFLEISVFDSGPGLTSQYSKKNISQISIVEEFEYTKECLTKNKTSATGESKVRKGKGLDRVLKTLNNKGFVKIRSGRTCLFRDLVNYPYEDIGDSRKIKIFDWYTNSENDITALSCVTGSVFSIIYPMDAYIKHDGQINLFQ